MSADDGQRSMDDTDAGFSGEPRTSVMSDLTELLDEKSTAAPVSEPTPEPQAAPEPVATEPEPMPEPKAEQSSGPAPLIEDGERSALVAQAKDERRKRQDLEKRLKDLERQIMPPQQHQPQQQQRPPQQVPQRPDPWTDPDGAAAYDRAQQHYALYETRVSLGEEIMRSAKPDYDEVVSVFREIASNDRMLAHQLVNSPNPAKFAYEMGKKLKLMSEIGDDPTAYETRLREKWEAERAAQTPAAPMPAPKAPAPKSLAGTPSAQPRDTKGKFASYDGPASLDELLG